MAIRVCPHCLKKVSPGPVVGYSDKLVCPHCNTPLAVSLPSRVIGGFIALGVGWLVWSYTRNMGGEARWVLPVLYTFLAYSVTYTIYLMATADLVKRPVEAEPAPISDVSHAHGGGHDVHH